MENNEDEPEDVRKATPVSGAIKSGEKDEKSGSPKATGKKKGSSRPSRCDKNVQKPTQVKSEADCCRGKITRSSKAPKMMSVLVYSPPCTLPRLEIIPRHCLSKQEYVDILAAPSRRCPPACLGKTAIRKIRPISARMNELAQPARRLIVSTLQERGEMLPPEMVDNLVKSIEGSACMTPEDAERYFRDKEREKEKKSPKISRQKCKGKSKAQCLSQLDKEAVMCQYLMAERFVKSIIQWKCPIPVEEFRDIASVILRRLSFVLEYTPTDGQDLKSQQMRFLADIIACWISGVLFEVAEEHKKEIEEEMQVQAEQEEEEEEDEDEEDEEKEEGPKKELKEPEEEDEEDVREKENEKEKEVVEEKKEKIQTQEIGTQTEELVKDKTEVTLISVRPEPPNWKEIREKEEARIEAEKRKNQEKEEEEAEEEDRIRRQELEEKARLQAAITKKREMEEAAENEAKSKAKLEEEKRKKEQEEEEARRKVQEKEDEEEKRTKEQQEEAEDKQREKDEQEKRKKDAEMKKKKAREDKLKEMGPKEAIARIGDDELFKTDLPFITFGKILDTVYKMLEDEPEGDETDSIHNRIQRALYEKFARLIELESPDALTENLKDVVDVLSGKAATWLKQLLKDTELRFMDSHPPEVESREIRDWGKWIDQVTDRAGDWADWIHRVVQEADDRGSKSVDIKRGDWQSWTSDTETNALLWRRYYLETVHQAHHNKMMLVNRPVVKTGEKGLYSKNEEEIENTELGSF